MGQAGVTSVELWAASQLAGVEFPDARLGTRATRFMATLAAHPGESFPGASGGGHQAKAAYRFIENERVTRSNILPSLADAAARTCAGQKRILVIQDTTSFNYSKLKATTGLGPIGDSKSPAQGIWCHTTLAATTSGKLLGVFHQELWVRAQEDRHKAEDRKTRPIEEKESLRWLTGVRAAHQAISGRLSNACPCLVHVGDREADICELFEEIRRQGDEAVIRCRHNRVTDHPLKWAFDAVRAAPLLGNVVVEVPRHEGHPARKAPVELRVCKLNLPAHTPGELDLQVNLVEVLEANPPADVEPLHWLLWTTVEVRTLADALQVVSWYKCRWRIEDVHLTLKSGYKTEELQFETAERLMKVILLFTAVAVRIVTLRDEVREQPEAPCTVILTEAEWRTLYAYFKNNRPQRNSARRHCARPRSGSGNWAATWAVKETACPVYVPSGLASAIWND